MVLLHPFLLSVLLLVLQALPLPAQGISLTETARQLFQNHFNNTIENAPSYQLEWQKFAVSSKGDAVFGLLRLSLSQSNAPAGTTQQKGDEESSDQQSSDALTEMQHTDESREYPRQINYCEGFFKPQHDNEEILLRACQFLIHSDEKNPECVLQYYAEIDRKNELQFLYISLPANDSLQLRQTLTYENYIEAEASARSRFIEKIKQRLSFIKEDLIRWTEEMKHAKAVVKRDFFQNPVCIFSPDCDLAIDNIRTSLPWMKGYIYYANPRNDLHKRLFQDDTYEIYTNLAISELTSLIADGNTNYHFVEQLRKSKISEFWEKTDYTTRVDHQQELRKTILAELDKSYRRWHRQGEHLKYASTVLFDKISDKSVYEPLISANNMRLQQVISLARELVLAVNLEDEDLDFAKIVDEIVKRFPTRKSSEESFDSQENSISELAGLDTRSYGELLRVSAIEANQSFPKTQKHLQHDDEQVVRESYPLYKFNQNISINRKIKGKQYVYNGYLKRIGPGKIMIGNRYITLNDLPEELSACFDKNAHKKFIAKKIAEHPVSAAYKKKKMEKANETFNALLLGQFSKNIPHGMLFVDNEWIMPEEALLYAFDPQRYVELFESADESGKETGEQDTPNGKESDDTKLVLDGNGNVVINENKKTAQRNTDRKKGGYRPVRQNTRRYRVQ